MNEVWRMNEVRRMNKGQVVCNVIRWFNNRISNE